MSRKNERTRKRTGHYCWACDRRRPNEKFSGRGHARHLCRNCAKLGAEELAYRQALRNMQRCLTWEGTIRRQGRKSLEQFLHHEDPRVRARAEEILKEDMAKRAYHRAMRELDDVMLEDEDGITQSNAGVEQCDGEMGEPQQQASMTEIPF